MIILKQTLEVFLIIWAVFLYAILLIFFGYLGYREAQSKISLWSGVGFGCLILLSALAMIAKRVEGAYVAFGATLLLTGIFAYRYWATAKPIPAVLALASGAMLILLLVRIAKWK